jgi:cytochrome P450
MPLLASMRELAIQISTQLLFGSAYVERSALASLLYSYFQMRREGTSQLSSLTESGRDELIALGESSDDALRRYIHWARGQTANAADGLLTRLCRTAGNKLSDDELVAHCNVLFMSSNEPIAVSLTWILLILSQLGDLRRELRCELEKAHDTTQLQWVINEALRVLTPNALMVRVTTAPASLNGIELPERCELVLCPFLAHREAERFPQPDVFLPQRWRGLKPSPFEYFPFGAGGHGCVGQRLAMYLLRTVLSRMLQRFDLVLDGDQEIDWHIHIMLMPLGEVLMRVEDPINPTEKAGKLLGPVAELVKL